MDKPPRATQELAVLPSSGKEVIRRWALCPQHKRLTSDYLGVSNDMWAFRCKSSLHLFHALPDRTAPKNSAEVDAWLEKQRQARIGVKGA